MDSSNKYLDERINEKFCVIEDKLRNSFQAVKKDSDFIKTKIEELSVLIEKSNSNKILKDFDKFRADVLVDIKDVRDEIRNDVSELNKEFSGVKKEVSKANIKSDIKSSLRKEVYAEFEKKIEKKFEKFSNESKDLKKNIVSYKNDIYEKANEAIDGLNSTTSEVRNIMEQEKESFARVVSSRNKSLEKEFGLLKEKISDKLYIAFKERDEKVLKIERQIAYIKGRLKGDFVEEKAPEIPKFEEVKKEIKSKDDKKKPFFIKVLTRSKDSEKKDSKKIVQKKDFKKLEKDDEGFFDSVIKSFK